MASAAAGVKWVVGGWTAFVVENIVMSENRTRIIAASDERTYQGVYSALSCASVGSLAYGYWKHGGGKACMGLSVAGMPRTTLGVMLKVAGAMGVAQSLPPMRNFMSSDSNAPAGTPAADMGAKNFCPIDLSWKKNAEGKDVFGLQRITRHPQLWSLAIFGMGFGLTTVCPVGRALGYGLTPTVAILGAHMDSRYARGIGGKYSEETWNTTSHIPFVAVVQGRQSLAKAWEESKQTNAFAAGTLMLLRSGSLFSA